MCPLKPDKVAALVATKLTFGYVTSAASIEKSHAEKKAKAAQKKEEQKASAAKTARPQSYDEKWKGSAGKGGGHNNTKKPIAKKRHVADKNQPRKRSRPGSDSA
jgi:hypothetical protein